MLTDNYTAFAHLLTQTAEKAPQELLPILVCHSLDALDEFILVSACLNKMASHTNFDEMPDGARMLSTVNCVIADLGHAIGSLNRYCENIDAIQKSKRRPKNSITPIQGKNTPQIGVKSNVGGCK